MQKKPTRRVTPRTPAENITAVQTALLDARIAQSLPYRALAASAVLAGEYAQAREQIAKAEQAEGRPWLAPAIERKQKNKDISTRSSR